MSPPTEQLIRDYLNRLSVAARGQLGPDDRRALVTRTRDLIERKTGLAGPPTSMEVARLLAGLGDPSRLVQQERQRLAAVRGELPQPAPGRNRISRLLRRDPGRTRSASWHWPVLEGDRSDLLLTLFDGDATQTEAQDDREASADALGGVGAANGVAHNGVARDQVTGLADEAAMHVPAQGNESGWFLRELGRHQSDTDQEAAAVPAVSADATGEPESRVPARPRWPLVVTRADADSGTKQAAGSGTTDLGSAQPAGATPTWQLTVPADPVVARLVRRAANAVATWYRRTPLEASAVVLLGLGGAIYPPVWLLGAAVALASRLWDYKDKWVGLALPPMLTLIAVVIGVATAGNLSVHHSIHEGWVFGVAASRIAAALSAGYLGWRSVHGRRPPAVPPWTRSHTTG